MKRKACSWEKEILNSLAAGNLKPELHQHMNNCPICQESAFIYQWMNQFQRASREGKMAEKPLPDAELLWERAFSAKRPDKELEKKAMRPLMLGQVFSYVVAVIALVFFIFFNLAEIRDFFNSSPVVDMILTLLSSMVKTFSFVLIPLILGFFSIIIFIFFITGFEPKKSGL